MKSSCALEFFENSLSEIILSLKIELREEFSFKICSATSSKTYDEYPSFCCNTVSKKFQLKKESVASGSRVSNTYLTPF